VLFGVFPLGGGEDINPYSLLEGSVRVGGELCLSLILQALHLLPGARWDGKVDRVIEGGLEVRVIHSHPSVCNNHFVITVT